MKIIKVKKYDQEAKDQLQIYIWTTHFINRCVFFGRWLIVLKEGDEQISKFFLHSLYVSFHFLQFLNG